jgi:hypothetical protein
MHIIERMIVWEFGNGRGEKIFAPMPIIERMIVWEFGNLPMYQCLLWNW